MDLTSSDWYYVLFIVDLQYVLLVSQPLNAVFVLK
jgi:hypothetical protein